MYVNREDQAVYDAQAEAFRDTPLDDRLSEESLRLMALEAVDTWWWKLRTAEPVKVGYGNPRMTWGGLGGRSGVRFNARGASRFVVPHELAHTLTHRLHRDRKHGPVYRGEYVFVVSAMFGNHYGELLRKVFEQFALPVDLAHYFEMREPMIDIDRLSAATNTRGGWRRP